MDARRNGSGIGRTRAVALLLTVALSGCAGQLQTVGAALAYRNAPLPADRVFRDIPYRDGDAAESDRQRLDVFVPEDADLQQQGGRSPVLVFVHGGGWTHGDRAMGLFGIEPIQNLGRFYAARGHVVVVPSYRLQPDVGWREQVDDIAASLAWVHEQIGRYGGDPDRVHLGGHSAGAWLAAWVGLADGPLAQYGLDRDFLCSLALVSGAAYDLTDEETYGAGASRDYFERLFGREGGEWARDASISLRLEPPFPPSLMMTAGGEPPKFQRQTDLLFAKLEPAAPGSSRVVVPGQDHQRIMVSLSREAEVASERLSVFLSETTCPRPAP